MFKYIWRHSPTLTAQPEECLKNILYENNDTACEMAVFKLTNEKYCFVKFLTDDVNNTECGATDIEEFETENEAVELFNELSWE